MLILMMDKMKVVEDRISERKRREPGEIVKDEVQIRLVEELARLKRSNREFNIVISNIR